MKNDNLESVATTVALAETPEGREGAIELAPVIMHLANILVPLDFSEMSLKALRYAVPFAKQFNAKLTLVHVVELMAYTPELPYPPALSVNETAEVKRELEKVRDANVPAEIPVDVVVRHDFAADAVIDVASRMNADLIITSTHGRTGLKHVFLGSTAEKIVRHAPCPVLVVRVNQRDFV